MGIPNVDSVAATRITQWLVRQDVSGLLRVHETVLSGDNRIVTADQIDFASATIETVVRPCFYDVEYVIQVDSGTAACKGNTSFGDETLSPETAS